MHKYEGHKTSYTTSTFSATLINSYHFGWTYSTYLRVLPLCSSFANSNLIKSKVALSEWILTSIFLRFFLKVKGELNCKGWKLVVSLNNEQKLKGNKSLVTPKVVEKSSMMVSQRKSAMTIIFSQKPNYMYCSGQLLNTLSFVSLELEWLLNQSLCFRSNHGRWSNSSALYDSNSLSDCPNKHLLIYHWVQCSRIFELLN